MHNKQFAYIYRDFTKTFSYKGIHQTADPCDKYKRQDRAGSGDAIRILSVVYEDCT